MRRCGAWAVRAGAGAWRVQVGAPAAEAPWARAPRPLGREGRRERSGVAGGAPGSRRPPPSSAARGRMFSGEGDGEGEGAPPAGEEVRAGDVFRSRRTFSREVLEQFSAMTWDANPIHAAAAPPGAAEEGGGRGPLVQGALLGSMFPSIIGSRFPGALYRKQTLTFRRPVHAGEEVLAEVAIHRVAPARLPGLPGRAPRRLVSARTTITDAHGHTAVHGDASFLL